MTILLLFLHRNDATATLLNAKNQRRSTDGVDEGEEEAVYRRNWKRGPHVALCALSELREGGVSGA